MCSVSLFYLNIISFSFLIRQSLILLGWLKHFISSASTIKNVREKIHDQFFQLGLKVSDSLLGQRQGLNGLISLSIKGTRYKGTV